MKKHLLRPLCIVLTAGSILATASNRAVATSMTWDPGLSTSGGTDGAGTWDTTTANWYNGTTTLQTWASADFADFGASGTAGTVTIGTPLTAAGLTINKTGYLFTGSALTLTSGGNSGADSDGVFLNTNVNAEIDNSLVLGTSGTPVLVRLSAGSGGSLTLTGGATVPNTFSSMGVQGGGSVFITAGSYMMNSFVAVAVGGETESGTATMAARQLEVGLSTGSTFTINSTAVGTAFTSSGGGQDFIGSSANGTLDLKAGTVSFTGANGLDITEAAAAAGSGTLKVEGGSLTTAGSIFINANGTTAGQAGTLTITGGTLTAPTIQFGKGSTAFGATTTGVLTVSGGNLYVGAGGIVENSVHPTTDTITLSGGTIGATANWTSSMAMALNSGNTTFKAANSSGTAFNIGLSGALTGGGALTKTGAGVLTLSSASNGYTGGTTISGGTLQSTVAGGLGSTIGSLAVNGGGTLDIKNVAQTVGAVTLGTVGTSTGSTIQSTGGTATLTTSGVTVNGTGNTIASSVGVTGAITQNSNSGLTVNGTAGADTLASGASLNGIGTVGPLTLSGGTVTAGSGGTSDVLTSTGNLTFNGGSTLAFNLSTSNGNSSLLNLGSNAFNIGTGGVYNISLTGGLATPGTVYDLVNFGSTTFTLGTSAQFTEIGSLAGNFVVTGNQLDFDVSAVPEPSTWAMLFGGLVFLTAFTQHRKRSV